MDIDYRAVTLCDCLVLLLLITINVFNSPTFQPFLQYSKYYYYY